MSQQKLFEEEPKKRKKPVMLTGRSRKFLERSGFIVALVERSLDVAKDKSNPFGPRFRNKFDAFSVADLIAVRPDTIGTLYIQVTDFHNAQPHKEKMLAAKAVPILLSASNRIELHLWKSSKQSGQKLWKLHIYKMDQSRADGVFFMDPDERWFTENMQDFEPDF
jgi:hypothetical protein